MKKMLALLLLLIVPMTAMATEVQSMIDELPAVSVLQEMDIDGQREVYDKTQAAYDAYMALPEEERLQFSGAEETFESLFGYFNTLIMSAEETGETGSDLLSTVIACLLGLLLAKKLTTKRKL